jgi:hypothetical protein
MSGELNVKSEIALHGTKNGLIKIGDLKQPYGANSENVVSIAVALNGSDADWKVHIPYANLDDVISALNSMKK